MNAPLASSSNPVPGMAPARRTSPALLVGAGLAAGVFAAAAGALVWQKVSTPAVLPQPEPEPGEPVLKEFGDATWVRITRTTGFTLYGDPALL